MAELNIEQDVGIDRFNLTKECISLPDTYRRYAEYCSEAKALVSTKSDMLKVVKAERNIAIRKECEARKEKVTEGIINSYVESDSQVIEAARELREAEAAYGRLSIAVSAIEIKKSEVDNLVKLYCNSMYVDTKPKVTSNFEDESIDDYNLRTMKPLPKKSEQ